MKTFQELREEAGKQHHFTLGHEEYADEKGNHDAESTGFLRKIGKAAAKAGAKVSYSTATQAGNHNARKTTGHSDTITRKHNLVHISHHDPKVVHKLLDKHADIEQDDHEMHNMLKSKTHGGHSIQSQEAQYSSGNHDPSHKPT